MKKTTGYQLAITALLSFYCLSGLSPSEATPKQLNSLVTELVHVESLILERGGQQISFENPRDGWVYIETIAHLPLAGELYAALADDTLTSHHLPDKSHQETMRWLVAGKHTLSIHAGGPKGLTYLGTLEVTLRAIPQLGFGRFRYSSWILPLGTHDWPFLKKYVHPNINCILGGSYFIQHDQPYIKQWRAQGKKWWVEVSASQIRQGDALARLLELAQASDGIIIDELGPENVPKNIDVLQQAMQLVADHGKEFATYCYDLVPGQHEDLPPGAAPEVTPSSEWGKAYIEKVVSLGQKIGWERYLNEKATEAQAKEYIDAGLKGHLKVWEQAIPGVRKNMILVLSQILLPAAESDNTRPEVNWKYFIDMQYHLVANDPAFEGLYGIHHWTSGYASEENVRWCSQLYRHYFIEGNTEMLSGRYGYTYLCGHITNPDFDHELNGWTLQPAEEGSITVKSMAGYGKFQGRRRSGDKGDTFLWTRRSATTANQVSQTMRDLIPGRLYSIKMITGDYTELVNGKASQGLNGISIRIKGAEVLSDRSFVEPQASRNKFNAFDRDNPYCFNFHWVVFRAKAETAELTISDWTTEGEPGEHIGQELIYNFIEVQPYFEGSIPKPK